MSKFMSSSAGFLLALLIATSAHASLVDFESVTTDQFEGSQTVEGFVWDFSASGWFIGPHDSAIHPDGTSNGTSNLVAAGDRDNDTARVLMTPVGGGSFSISGLDAATARNTDVNILDILGTFTGGGTILASINIDGSFDSYNLTGFSGLSSVLFSSRNSGAYNFGGFSIDNITDGGQVPEPLTLGLLGLGLAGIGLARRRRLKA